MLKTVEFHYVIQHTTQLTLSAIFKLAFRILVLFSKLSTQDFSFGNDYENHKSECMQSENFREKFF